MIATWSDCQVISRDWQLSSFHIVQAILLVLRIWISQIIDRSSDSEPPIIKNFVCVSSKKRFQILNQLEIIDMSI